MDSNDEGDGQATLSTPRHRAAYTRLHRLGTPTPWWPLLSLYLLAPTYALWFVWLRQHRMRRELAGKSSYTSTLRDYCTIMTKGSRVSPITSTVR
jgi:hypothetical protein